MYTHCYTCGLEFSEEGAGCCCGAPDETSYCSNCCPEHGEEVKRQRFEQEESEALAFWRERAEAFEQAKESGGNDIAYQAGYSYACGYHD